VKIAPLTGIEAGDMHHMSYLAEKSSIESEVSASAMKRSSSKMVGITRQISLEEKVATHGRMVVIPREATHRSKGMTKAVIDKMSFNNREGSSRLHGCREDCDRTSWDLVLIPCGSIWLLQTN
jgi:hypothetical protein